MTTESNAYSRWYYKKHRKVLRAAARGRYYSHRDQVLARLARLYRAEREWLDSLKSKPCLDCRESYPPCVMEFDHVRGIKKYTIGRMMGSQMARATILAEIAKCDLVCANCHRIRTYLLGRPINGNTRKCPGSKDEDA